MLNADFLRRILTTISTDPDKPEQKSVSRKDAKLAKKTLTPLF